MTCSLAIPPIESTDTEVVPVESTDSTQVENDLPVVGPPQTSAPAQLTFTSKQHLGHHVAKINVRIQGTDKVNIDFRSTGEQDLRASEGKPVVATGSTKDRTAVVHGNVPGSSILIDNPA